MADPYAQLADPIPQPASDPYAAIGVPAAPSLAIDPSLSRAEVRAKLAALPKAEQGPALKAWADAKVKADSEADQKTLLGRMSSKSGDASRQYLRGSIGGIGAWLDELNAVVQSGAVSGPGYEVAKALEDAKNRSVDAQETHLFNVPGVDRVLGPGAGDVTTGTARKIAGGLMTAPVTPLMRGGQAAGLGGQVLTNAAGGLLYGTAGGAGEGNSLEERAGNAAAGAVVGPVVGGLAPVVGRLAGNATGYLANKGREIPSELSQYKPQAVRSVARAAEADNIGSPKAPVMPETTIADMGSNLRLQAQGIYSQQGPGRAVIADTLEQRREGIVPRINSGMDRTLGGAQNLVKLEADVLAAQGAKAAPFREKFYTSQVPWTDDLLQILERAKETGAFGQAAKWLKEEGLDPTDLKNAPRLLDKTKQALDDMASKHFRAGENNAGGHYNDIAKALRGSVDDAFVKGGPSDAADIAAHLKAGGSPDDISPWAMARYHSGEGLQFKEGLEEGGKAFSKSTHPDQLRADMETMSGPNRLGYVYGARGQYRDTVGNAASALRQNGDVQAMRMLGSEYARDKLEQIAAPIPGAAKKLTDRLDSEAQMQNTYNKVMGGPETAERLAAQKEFPQSPEMDKTPRVLPGVTVTGALAQGVYSIIDTLRAGALTQKNVQIAHDAARMLMAQGGDREVIRQALLSYAASKALSAPQQRAVEYLVAALGRSAIAPASPNVQRR